MVDRRPGRPGGRGYASILNHLKFFARLIPSRAGHLRPLAPDTATLSMPGRDATAAGVIPPGLTPVFSRFLFLSFRPSGSWRPPRSSPCPRPVASCKTRLQDATPCNGFLPVFCLSRCSLQHADDEVLASIIFIVKYQFIIQYERVGTHIG